MVENGERVGGTMHGAGEACIVPCICEYWTETNLVKCSYSYIISVENSIESEFFQVELDSKFSFYGSEF